MVERIQLTSKEILEKDFKTAIRGYNQEEVDQFLDVVIQDYEALQNEIERLKQENARLKGTQNGQTRVRQTQSANTGHVNYDILKRLSNLEKAVFGKKYAD
ncbi:cell division regulator GpsB [Salinibacillus xinjiangensis]|uniref:Cell division regulator GpsB n=1 Tax=Salinibacillus xinjiangensis TaxID=1229268 RepID=A0A6G1XBN5_9BACI|nr:cell division regulator GpsB [Salinibacillus xinjiangensis]MRG88290.1 cell division regulator GpsB [Salinibacillus xinjiangensis]